jgi:hypothetical protein
MARPPCPAPRPSVAPAGGIGGSASIPAGGNGPVASLEGPGMGGTGVGMLGMLPSAFRALASFPGALAGIPRFSLVRIASIPYAARRCFSIQTSTSAGKSQTLVLIP